MKRLFTIICGAAMMVACNNTTTNKTQFSCDLSALDTAEAGATVELVVSGEDEALATATLDESKIFVAEVEIPAEQYVTLKLNDKPVTEIITEGHDISLNYNVEEQKFDITGTTYNERMREFMSKAQEIFMPIYTAQSEEEAEAIIEEFTRFVDEQVVANKDNILALQMLQVYGQYAQNDERFVELFNMINPKYNYLELYKATQRTMIGAELVDITLNNTTGQAVSVAELCKSGKWVLVDFWATWCGPCRGEIPHLVAAYEKFAPKGLEIYGVTLDRPGTEEKWMQFIVDNNMTWVNVWGYNEANECIPADTYNVSSIPTNFLFSPEGKLVAKNLRGEEIEKILAEHIK